MHQTSAHFPACFTRHDALAIVGGMMDPKIIDDLARRLSKAVPTGLREARQDIEKNFRTVLQNTLEQVVLGMEAMVVLVGMTKETAQE